MRPRLIHLAGFGAPYSGSFVPMLLALGNAARSVGWSVEFVFPERARDRPWLAEFAASGFECRFMAESGSGLDRWASWLAAEAVGGARQSGLTREITKLLAATQTPTILHTHFSAFDVAAAHAGRKGSNTFVIWHEQSLRRPGWKPAIGGLLKYRLFGRTVHRFLCVAPDVAESITRLAHSERVRFVPNAIDSARFRLTTDKERDHARLQIGIERDAVVVLHFGWDWHRKGGDHYLSAMRLLSDAASGRRIRGITVGAQDARAAVRAAGLESAVMVLESREDVQSLYAAADVVVSSSRAEGMPFAVLEALACGVPVIASDIAGHAFVGKNVSACVVAPLNGRSIAGAVQDVINWDATQRQRETGIARQWVVDQMGLASWSRTIIGVYNELLERPS